jgi:hypothetical protein
MSTSATGSANQSAFSIVRIPLRRGDDDATTNVSNGAGPPDRISSPPDLAVAGALDRSADRGGDHEARPATSVQAATEGDAELDRLRKCLWALQEEIDTLPRASQLPPIPGLPLLDARMAPDPGAIDPTMPIRTLSRQRSRKALSALTLFLIASAIAVPVAGYYGAGSFARLLDELDAPARPSADAQRAALLRVPEAVRAPRAVDGIAGSVGSERAVGATSPPPTTDLENKPGEDEASAPQAAQGTENRPPEAGPSAAETLVDEAASQGDTVVVLDTEGIKSLLDRGRQYLDAGDVAAARLLFNRAANAGDVAAAVAMGTTYDPAVLGSRGVHGLSGDPQRARGWYEKAAELGSAEGLRLLKALDGRLAVAGTRQAAERVDSGEAPGKASFAINRDQGRAVPHDLLMRRQPGPYYKPKH